jgi:hypothetical protein
MHGARPSQSADHCRRGLDPCARSKDRIRLIPVCRVMAGRRAAVRTAAAGAAGARGQRQVLGRWYGCDSRAGRHRQPPSSSRAPTAALSATVAACDDGAAPTAFLQAAGDAVGASQLHQAGKGPDAGGRAVRAPQAVPSLPCPGLFLEAPAPGGGLLERVIQKCQLKSAESLKFQRSYLGRA